MKLRELLKKWELPNYTCDVCGREVFCGERICRQCYEAFPWIQVKCPICGRAQRQEGICLECKQKRPDFYMARSLFRHEQEAARLVLRCKNGEKYLIHTISELLLLRRLDFPEAEAVSFVPMTKKSEKMRGYNQSYLLAEAFAKQSGLELIDAAEKIRETDMQKTLGKIERQKNLKGCFKITDRKSVKGKRILLIDDTLTTGATVNELSSQFLAAKAEKVFVLTVTSVGEKLSENAKRGSFVS